MYKLRLTAVEHEWFSFPHPIFPICVDIKAVKMHRF